MKKEQTFVSEKASELRTVVDLHWADVDDQMEWEKPGPQDETVDSVFNKNFLRIGISHFRDGQKPKHNAQTDIDSAGCLISCIKSLMKNGNLKYIIIRTDNSPKEFGVAVFLAKKHNIQIFYIFMAEYHGYTPCDAEQRYVKQMPGTLGTTNKSFRENLTSFIDHLNRDIGQPAMSDKTLTSVRRAFFIPEIEISKSIWMATDSTRSLRSIGSPTRWAPWGGGALCVLQNVARSPNIVKCGEVEFVTFKKKPEFR